MWQTLFVWLVVLLSPLQVWAQSMEMKRRWIAADKLPYFTDAQFQTLVRDGVLVKIRDSQFHVIDNKLDFDAQYIRPFVLTALRPFEEAFFRGFHHPIRINAAFRTKEHHADLRTRNANAALGNSPHSTGCTLDISLLAMSVSERRFAENWFRARHGKTLVLTIEHHPYTMYDVFFRPPKPPAQPHHKRAR
jgi:hypothetical protein